MSSDTVLSVQNISKSYRSYRKPQQKLMELVFKGKGGLSRQAQDVYALEGISLELKRGEILGIIGPNGAGKSTLLQIIAGTLRPTSGEVTIGGRVTALLELGAGVDPEMTGRENIFLMGRTYGLDNKLIESKVDEIISFSGLGAYIEQPVKTYSSGMFVRLAFSISTAIEPDLLIVDEALSVGDVGFQAKCLDRLDALIQQGTSILLASHDLQLIKTYCTSAICINDGKIVEEGDPELVAEKYFHLMRSNNQSSTDGLEWHATESGNVRFKGARGHIDTVKIDQLPGAQGFRSGERVTVSVSGILVEADIKPSISVMLRDLRGFNIYGIKAFADKVVLADDLSFSVSFSIPLNLATGQYSLTVKLEDSRTKHISTMLDKHVGVCHFSVENTDDEFLGVVNLAGSVQ